MCEAQARPVDAVISRPMGGQRVPEPWLSADDIAAHVGVTKETVDAWITVHAKRVCSRPP